MDAKSGGIIATFQVPKQGNIQDQVSEIEFDSRGRGILISYKVSTMRLAEPAGQSPVQTSETILVPIFDDVQATVEYFKQRITRCLTQRERQEAFLEPEPPHWCITGHNRERESDPAKWQGKWPYDTTEWKAWLVDLRQGTKSAMPTRQQ